MIRAGNLRHRITIQAPANGTDGYGAPVPGWADFAVDVQASIRPLSSRELIAAQAAQSETSHEIRMRYMPGITAAMRAVFNGRYFNLSRPLNVDERNIELIIPATEGLNDG
jgi:SPP1 family predicted phage head-tail adaptor